MPSPLEDCFPGKDLADVLMTQCHGSGLISGKACHHYIQVPFRVDLKGCSTEALRCGIVDTSAVFTLPKPGIKTTNSQILRCEPRAGDINDATLSSGRSILPQV